jgi:hypothetical protein
VHAALDKLLVTFGKVLIRVTERAALLDRRAGEIG